MTKPTHEELLAGEVCTVSLINEPVTEEPQAESAAERARRRWFERDPLCFPERFSGSGNDR